MENCCCWRLRYVNKAGQHSASQNPTGDHHNQLWKMKCALRSVQEEDAPVIQASGCLSRTRKIMVVLVWQLPLDPGVRVGAGLVRRWLGCAAVDSSQRSSSASNGNGKITWTDVAARLG